jgi:hypothetical protein
MAVYTVHQPPLRNDEASPNPDRFVFVRDGFHLWGFLLAPLWMAWNRLWLVLILYLSLTTVLEVGLRLIGTPAPARAFIAVLIALLVGMEAASLKRWTLARRRYKNVGVVVADDPETAERQFFAAWVGSGQIKPQTTAASYAPPRMPRDDGPDILGLFPKPDSSR